MTPATLTYEPIVVSKIINRVQNMPFRWSINPYRGCTHRCIYCYARPTHAYLGFDDPSQFDRHIFVKENAVTALRRQLSHPSWRREEIVIGTVTDPYQPAEAKFRLTRAVLEVLLEYRNPVSITTKSPLVCRDLDLLVALSAATACTVNFSIATLDPAVWRVIEPGAPHPRQRLRALATLRATGIRAGVLLAPVLPGLTDRGDRLEAVVRAAVDHGACFVEPLVLRLPSGVREWCLAQLASTHPHLAAAYARHYRTANAPTRYVRRIQRRVADLLERLGAAVEPRRHRQTLPLRYEQLQLPC
ncbi:MAG TPA: radical SAM protein [Bacillota bacterium]